MRFIHLSALLLAATVGLVGCSTAATVANAPAQTAQADVATEALPAYETYAQVVATYVSENGLVDYSALQASRQGLDDFNDSLDAVDDATYASWSEADQIAYWVNAYNSLTLKSIIDEDPIKASIKNIRGVWRIRKHPILGQEKTLDNIEHQTLRANFDEPRIHAALVCAAISCPPLRTEPFTGEDLDAQLDDQVEQWLAKPDGLAIDQAAGEVRLSKIFDWFGQDWIPSYGVESGFAGSEAERAVLNFISNYVSEEERAYLVAGDYTVSYFGYDWSLNDQP
ncbi:MAG: DUF547 domain-containing protein [Cyanobacteria bacterium P01_A01_bin.105]